MSEETHVARRWLPYGTSSSLWDAWRPIETAPKDGTYILGYAPGADVYGDWSDDGPAPAPWVVLHWSVGCWHEPHYDAWSYSPTHWMPLPEPPTKK